MPPAPRATRARWFSWSTAIAVGAAFGAGAFVYYHHTLEPPARRRDDEDVETPSRETRPVESSSASPPASPATPGASSAVGGSTPAFVPGTSSPAPSTSPRLSKKDRQKLAVSRAQSELLGSGAFGEGDDEFAETNTRAENSTEKVSLDAAFADAAVAVESIVKRMTSADKLRVYGLYKQATEGPCVSPKPRLLEGMTKHAKWTAWSELGDLDSNKAKREYVALVRSLTKSQTLPTRKALPDETVVFEEDAVRDSDDVGLGGPVFSRPELPFDGPSGPGGPNAGFLDGLALACRAGDVAGARALMISKKKIDFDARDEEGRTALHWAADGGHAETCLVVLEGVRAALGADAAKALVDAVDDEGQTALHYAAVVESAATCAVLIRWGADCDVLDADGETPAELGARELAASVEEAGGAS